MSCYRGSYEHLFEKKKLKKIGMTRVVEPQQRCLRGWGIPGWQPLLGAEQGAELDFTLILTLLKAAFWAG